MCCSHSIFPNVLIQFCMQTIKKKSFMLYLCVAGLVNLPQKRITACNFQLWQQSSITQRAVTSAVYCCSSSRSFISSSDFILKDEVEGGHEPPAFAGLSLCGLGLLCHHLHTLVLFLWSWHQLGAGSPDQGTLS